MPSSDMYKVFILSNALVVVRSFPVILGPLREDFLDLCINLMYRCCILDNSCLIKYIALIFSFADDIRKITSVGSQFPTIDFP